MKYYFRSAREKNQLKVNYHQISNYLIYFEVLWVDFFSTRTSEVVFLSVTGKKVSVRKKTAYVRLVGYRRFWPLHAEDCGLVDSVCAVRCYSVVAVGAWIGVLLTCWLNCSSRSRVRVAVPWSVVWRRGSRGRRRRQACLRRLISRPTDRRVSGFCHHFVCAVVLLFYTNLPHLRLNILHASVASSVL